MSSIGEGGDQSLDLDFTLVVETAGPEGVGEVDLAHLSRFVLEAEHANGSWDVTVALVDDGRLQALHRDYMGIDSPTDVMTFPSDDAGGRARGGDLVISVDHAQTQAETWGMTPDNEVRFLVVHGLLHLLGWRDDNEAERQVMLDRQQALFEHWRAEGANPAGALRDG